MGRFLLAMAVSMSALAAADGADTTIADTGPDLSSLPLWAPMGPGSITSGLPLDTLTMELPATRLRTDKVLRNQRWIGGGLMLIMGGLSYHFHIKADEAYNRYRRTGDIAEMDRLFEESRRYDRLSGWTFAGAEAGLALIAISFARAL
ncbi:MAG: hypothetical protein KAU50_07055 [Candidatus Marinimicrobia bacterium]|nr:hypothetical protein [Candidatus Neomarinimicrobiota bacterium]